MYFLLTNRCSFIVFQELLVFKILCRLPPYWKIINLEGKPPPRRERGSIGLLSLCNHRTGARGSGKQTDAGK